RASSWPPPRRRAGSGSRRRASRSWASSPPARPAASQPTSEPRRMPTIEILASPAGVAVAVEGAGRLIDVCDEAHAPVEFSCRSANCGTCRVEVLAGAGLLEPPGEEELRVLASPTPRPVEAQRLACQAV